MQLEESAVAGVTSVRLKIGEPFVKFEKTSPPGMIRVRVLCEIAATEMATGTPIYEGELKPEIGVAKIGNLNGTNASKPSQFRFAGASTGALHSEFPKFPPGGEDQFTEVAKYLGYNEQELITVKP
jgi:hypothetical protein